MKQLIIITYLIYIIVYETLILGGTAYIVFWKGNSGWWFVLAFVLAMNANTPQEWYSLINGKKNGK